MKNQARVAEIFNRAEAYQINASRDDSRPKSTSWQKPWVRCLAGLLVVVLLFGTGVGLFFGLKDLNHGIKNFDKMYIANFANYKAIGAGSTDTTAEQILQPQGLQPAAAGSNGKHYLVGVDKDNNIERCKASRNKHSKKDNKKDDDAYEIDYEISNIYAFTRYTFVEFSDYSRGFFYCKDSYVIDNLTGKFYSLDVFDELKAIEFAHTRSLESDDGVFVTLKKSYSNDSGSIYKLYVKDDNLVMEEVFDYSLNLGVSNYFVDKYNNIYFTKIGGSYPGINDDNQYIDLNSVRYIVSNGKLYQTSEIGLDENTYLFRSLNGVCYTYTRKYDYNEHRYYGEYAKYIGADGQLHNNDFDGSNYFFEKEEKVKTVGNVDYYFHNKNTYGNPYDCELFQVIWEDKVKFKAEKIEYSRPVAIKGYVTTKDYIYIIEENMVSKIEITTGNVEPLNSEYTFTSIQADYLGNVIFNGNDKDMKKIVGVITNDGEISILTKPREYQIYYIAPVN